MIKFVMMKFPNGSIVTFPRSKDDSDEGAFAEALADLLGNSVITNRSIEWAKNWCLSYLQTDSIEQSLKRIIFHNSDYLDNAVVCMVTLDSSQKEMVKRLWAEYSEETSSWTNKP